MSHSRGGKGNYFSPVHTFGQVYEYVGYGTVTFISTTGEQISARQGKAKDGTTLAITFEGENSIHGNVCWACWGYRMNCSGTRIGQCTEGLDRHMTA
jgi:hypothetical protein